MINLDGGIYNGFRIMHSDQFFFDYTEDFYNAVKIDIDNIIDEKQNLAVDEIEKVVYAICKTIAIEVPENLQNPEWDKLLINKAELKHYEELLRLTTRNNYDVSAYIKDAEKLFRYYNKGKSKEEIHLDFTTTLEEYFIKENEVCVHETTFFSDWKFDAESMEWGISKMINTDFTFAYPEDTYSHDLFPFIQEELDKNALELMNLDTYGDSYLFFVAHKNEVNRIIELAQIIGLGIEKI